MYISHSEGILNFSCGWVGGLVAEVIWWVWKMRLMLNQLSTKLLLKLKLSSATLNLAFSTQICLLNVHPRGSTAVEIF